MKKRTTVYIDEVVWKKLRHMALDKGVTTSQLLEEVIKEKLKNKN
jgi:predicted DNA-binding ribbon-helix-helix protein